MHRPPSTSSATPVSIAASSEQRKTAALPRSSGVENRPSEIVARNLPDLGGILAEEAPQQRRFARDGAKRVDPHPKGASSTAIALVAVIIHPFEALYQERRGRGLIPPVEAMLRITPEPRAFIAGTKARAVR